MTEKIKIPHLGILVTTYCNLNCRNCADLIPKRERKHYDMEAIKNDLHRILSVVEFIEEILVIGGEVILYPNLIEILDFCAQQPQIGKIIITTNGSLMPKHELLNCLSRNKVLVRVSGYPESVVPNRKEVIAKYKDYAINIDDYENMVWLSMGDEKKRERSEAELQKVFHSCSMKDCVAMNSDGKIYYCARQLSAMELPIYPEPKENEYIDVRNTKNLYDSFRNFYSLSYISTCNYCDGISCATKTRVSTATQILDKKVYLDAISVYGALTNINDTAINKAEVLKNICHILGDYKEKIFEFIESVELADALENFVADDSEKAQSMLKICLKNFLNVLAGDYNFIATKNVPYAKECSLHNMPNVITVGMYPEDAAADILLTENDIYNALKEKYPLDGIVYNKLFIESKLKRLETENISCIVSGLSYTQYGILENAMPCPTVNLSITGEDTPYSLLIAEYALKINPKVEYIIIPMTYYQSCYDMTNDDISLHKNVVSRINIPILKNARNFKNGIENTDGYCEGNPLKIFDIALDLDKARIQRDDAIREQLSHMEYFNEMNPQNALGGLKFVFQNLSSYDEKAASAKITAEHNERICTKEGYLEVKKYLESFLNAMKYAEKKVIIFVPPMTEYLYKSYHRELKEFYYDKIVTVLEQYDNVTFLDLAMEETFLETDFCDFEHLNYKGAEKLTKIIGKTIK